MMRANNQQLYSRTNKSFEKGISQTRFQEWDSSLSNKSYGFDRIKLDLDKVYDDKTWQPYRSVGTNIFEKLDSNKVYDDKIWQPQLPADINIFKFIDPKLNTIKNNDVKEAMMNFISLFKNTLSLIVQHDKGISPLPPIYLTENEEDSAYLEWTFENFRFVFSFNQKQEESYWLLVSNEKLKRYSISGDLIDNTLKSEISQIIHIALRNQ